MTYVVPSVHVRHGIHSNDFRYFDHYRSGYLDGDGLWNGDWVRLFDSIGNWMWYFNIDGFLHRYFDGFGDVDGVGSGYFNWYFYLDGYWNGVSYFHGVGFRDFYGNANFDGYGNWFWYFHWVRLWY